MAGPPPPPWAPGYAAWYSHWWFSSQYPGHHHTRPLTRPPPQPPAQPPPPPPAEESDQPPPPGGEEESCEPPAKKPWVELSVPPPPPPPGQAARKGAVIYATPRPPSPEPPKPSQPVVMPPPRLVEQEELAEEQGRMQWFYDGESWVYARQQPPVKPPRTSQEKFDYGGAGSEDPVNSAVMANLRGKFSKADKPKAKPARCEVCSLTVTCEKTLESHMAGRPHKKRLAQLERIKQLEEKVKVDTERALNSLPGGSRPGNPLQSRPNGDIHCRVCDCTMNSGAQAQSHIGGVKHRTKMDRAYRSLRGFRGGRGGFGRGFGGGFGGWGGGGRGGWAGAHWGPAGPELSVGGETGGVCSSEEAEEEYERVLSEALADNVDLEEATARAEAAKQAALSVFTPGSDSSSLQEEEEEEEEGEVEGEGTFPPPGIQVISEPAGETAGCYRCSLCGVMLLAESSLQAHLQTAAHRDKAAGRGSGSLGRGRGRGKIYRGKHNANTDGTMKAQRGRRGLISHGELLPDRLTKSQRKAQPKDIAGYLAQKAGLEKEGDIRKHAPLLMNFVKGGVMEGNQ